MRSLRFPICTPSFEKLGNLGRQLLGNVMTFLVAFPAMLVSREPPGDHHTLLFEYTRPLSKYAAATRATSKSAPLFLMERSMAASSFVIAEVRAELLGVWLVILPLADILNLLS